MLLGNPWFRQLRAAGDVVNIVFVMCRVGAGEFAADVARLLDMPGVMFWATPYTVVTHEDGLLAVVASLGVADAWNVVEG